jgi:hypothetical protein
MCNDFSLTTTLSLMAGSQNETHLDRTTRFIAEISCRWTRASGIVPQLSSFVMSVVILLLREQLSPRPHHPTMMGFFLSLGS